MAAEARKDLILVDGSGYVFRAFFALPQLNNSRGMPTNAVYGFIRMLLKLLKEERPTHIGVVFDSPKRTFRDDLFADYKANRAEAPNDLVVQIPFIHRAVEAFRIKSIVREGYEADDVIGTLAARAVKSHFATTIITADKDFMQIVGPHITLWDTMRDRRIAARDVRDRFGVEPSALVDIQALTGDSIDNVKGVPGVGEKTACALIQKFGSIKELYAHLDQIEEAGIRGAKKVAGLLAEHRQAVDLALKLVKIETAMPLDIEPDMLLWPGIDEPAVAELIRELEFNSLMQEIAPSQAELPMGTTSSEVIVTAADLPSVIMKLGACDRLGFDLTLSPIGEARLQIAGGGESYTFEQGLIGKTAELLANQKQPKAVHDLKAHLLRLKRYGVRPAGVDFDTMIAAFLINAGKPEPTITDLYHEYLAPLGTRAIPGSNAEVVAALQAPLSARLEADGLAKLFHEIEMPIALILNEMEALGIAVDREALATISREFDEEVKRLERECYDAAGRTFNLNSPIQLREILFDHLKLATKGLKKTKSGYSTDADTLEKLAAAHPMPRKLIEYRVIAKLKSTYADALSSLIATDGRVHTTFHQANTATGRVSSSDPNLQNIPTRSVEGRRIRRAFVPAPGYVLLSVDYSQIDLRVLAHLSGDETLVSAFREGEDIHARTASELLGVSRDNVDAEARRVAKTINFGIIYGMGPQRLAAQLGIALADASDYIKRYFERLPGIRVFMDETVRRARETGYVTTMYGRRRYVPEINAGPGGARAQAERIAINTPIQGSAADLIKIAMIRVDAEFKKQELDSRLLLQVHDELLIEVRKERLQEAAALAKREMEGVAEMKVPLRADVKSGSNWAEMDRES
ncbi:MAG TPA: DNA polymerase I [Candidatus Binataceae bacterium]|nr:DNA polymerase I [Candidatus Binataceae bacterium]